MCARWAHPLKYILDASQGARDGLPPEDAEHPGSSKGANGSKEPILSEKVTYVC